jgi:5'-nucleotidase
VYDNFTSEPLGNGKVSHTIEWQGRKIGFIGLVEEDWVVTLSTVDPNDITVTDFVDEGTTIANDLKASGVDYIIALTHMRWPNDERLAASVDEIDLILGGHDHNDGHLIVNGKHVIKSGSDFREFAVITLDFTPGRTDIVSSVEFVNVTKDIPEDEEIKQVVESFNSIISEKMEVPLGEFGVELDGRFTSVRTQETNLGNFMCDIMLRALDCDVAVLNSGTLRSDVIHPAGVFKMKDMMNILPMLDSLIVLEVTADQLIEALENGVSKYPALEGRFPQVSGVEFAFRSSKPGGQRIDRDSVLVGGAPLDEDRKYRLCTKSYLAEGKDGYDVFKKCTVLVDEENSPTMHTIIENHFTAIKVCFKLVFKLI